MNHTQRISWLFPILLVLYEISVYLSNDMYLPALPEMMHSLGISAKHAQLTVTMWFLGSATMPLVMGALADHFGRRKVLLIGGLFYVISTVFCALAVDEYSLLIPRVIQGAMISSMMVAGYAVIHESYSHKDAVRILAMMGAVSVLAPAVGPLAGACILLFTSWREIFWLIALYASTMLILLYKHMPETLMVQKHQPLEIRKVLHSYWLVLSNPKFLILMAVLGGVFAGFISWITASPLLIIDSLHFSQINYGWMQASVFAAYIAGSNLVNHLLKTREPRDLVNIGLTISLFAGLSAGITSIILPHQFYLFLISVIIYSFGSSICFASLNRLIIETSDEPMGIRVALFTAGLMGCGVLGSGVASIVFNGTSFSLGIIITIGIVLACGILVVRRVMNNDA